jgi:hypothetical protein
VAEARSKYRSICCTARRVSAESGATFFTDSGR